MPLTFRKRKFAEGLTAGLPPRDAALTAGYRDGKGLKVTASRLMRDKHVQAHMARARQWAQAHGGRLVAHSDGPGSGCTFTLAVPLSSVG